MISLTKRALAFVLALIMIFSCSITVFSAESDGVLIYSDTANSGTRGDVCTTLEGTGAADYYTEGVYDSATLTQLTDDELLASLGTLMTSTHTTITSYANCRDYAPITDCQNADATSVVLLYTSFVANMQLYTNNTPGGWNREHVWPQSLGNFGESRGGADLHHIRPADSSVNSGRGNKLYGVSNSTSTSKGSSVTGNAVGGTYNGIYFEPLDNVKGDVARICLYVYVRWGAQYPGYCDDITNVFQSIDILLEWCALDPVDTWEMGRNEVVENIQGNRNVFIDYPEYAWLLFDREVPADITTPSGLAQEIGVMPCDHLNTEIREHVEPDCKNMGYSGDLWCIDCNVCLQEGEQLPVSTVHNFNDWIRNEDGSFYHRECAICAKSEYITIDDIVCYVESDAEKILLILTLGVTDMKISECIKSASETQE